jgi:2-dehydro-3-deoxy-D-arabinonate dehydratase
MTGLFKLHLDGEVRWARGPIEDRPTELLPLEVSLAGLLGLGGDDLADLERLPAAGDVPASARIVAPLDEQEVWAAGVTYRRSRDARMEESTAPDHYDRVYAAERPELFFKASPGRVRGVDEPIGVREDSGWNVPEPELAVVVDVQGHVVGYVVGNDVSSRTIEGDNPLYLPQAKVYAGSCALGPCIVPVGAAPALSDMRIQLAVTRDDEVVYRDEVSVDDLRHEPQVLASWLYRAMPFPAGAILLTGTAIVPPNDFTLTPGDVVDITIAGLGTLRNPVELVATGPPTADRKV